uniref:Uncharacterized protein n=1 Tax=Chrysotila carterae TaxID=13221 RepID=A0A6S9VAX5_CHRCT
MPNTRGAAPADHELLVEKFETQLYERLNRNVKKVRKEGASSGSRRRRARGDAADAALDAEEEGETDVLRLDRQPACIENGKLRPYQLESLNWLLNLHARDLNGILADEMGLGKTLQTISLLGYLTIELRMREPHLVIVPKSVLGNWQNELRRFCPKLRVVKLQGGREERARIMKAELIANKFDMCLVTYEGILQESAFLRKTQWAYLVVDEAHRLKNEHSKLATLCRQIPTRRRLLLTGTPVQNNMHELWALLNFLYPEIFTTAEPFDASFDSKAGHLQQKLVGRLQRMLQGCLLRRLKVEVEKGLPPKTETKLFLPLSKMQASWYRRILLRDLTALSVDGGSKGSTHAQNIVMQLRKVCNHPYLFEGAEPGPPYVEGEHMILNSGKMVVLDKLLRKLQAAGSRVLIFTTMTRMLDVIEDYCRYRDYSFCRLDGSSSCDEREAMMAEFNRPGTNTFLFILSTRAGGLGINLHTADTVILFDSDWNPQADLQAQDRAHRIGQTKPVSVYRFIMEGTLEEKIVERAERKLYLDRLLVEQGRLAVQMPKRSKEELLGMVRFGADVVLKSGGTELTDAQVDELISKGQMRTKELADKILADCQHTLADFNMEKGDASKLYEVDGVEYDAKGLHELVRKLHAADAEKRSQEAATGMQETPTESLVGELLAHWQMLRTLRVCDEPGVPKREGLTMHDIVKMKLAAATPPHASEVERSAWYTVDKREATDKQWPIVAFVLQRFGFDGVDPEQPEKRSVRIPPALCASFDETVVAPWQAAWKTFRGSQRARGADGKAPEVDAEVLAINKAEVPHVRESSEMSQSQHGDSVYAWGCLDWISNVMRHGSDKKSERGSFIVSHPALLQAPETLPQSLEGEEIAQIACGGRHAVLLTRRGAVFAWGRGASGCLGLVATGCTGIPRHMRVLELARIRIATVACGGEHTFLRDDRGRLYSCGSNKRGQLGLGPTEAVTLPQPVSFGRPGDTAAAVSCGSSHTAVVLTSGALLTCGAYDAGGLGQARPSAASAEWPEYEPCDCAKLTSVSVLSPASTPVAAVSAGNLHTLALTRQTHLYAFGAGSWGRLGLGDDNREKPAPTLVKAALHLNITAVSAGFEHSLLLSADGSLYQFGRSGAAYQSTPSPVPGIGPSSGVPVVSVSAGKSFSVACDGGGGVWVWGVMPNGALGLGERDGAKVRSARLPTLVDKLSGRHVIAVAAGHSHIVALASSQLSTAEQMALTQEERFGDVDQDEYDDKPCEICNEKEHPDGSDLAFCDWCNKAFHYACHYPPPPEGCNNDWFCGDCQTERLASCAICGMQDELQATLILCDTPDCTGAIHIECMHPSRRPTQISEDKDASAASAQGETSTDTEGERRGDDGRKARRPPPPKAPDQKRRWKLDNFTWFCETCEASKPVKKPRRSKQADAQQPDAKQQDMRPAASGGADKEAGGTAPEENDKNGSAVGEVAPAGAAGALAEGGDGDAAPVPLRELTPAHRRLLRQFHAMCSSPDADALRLLGAAVDCGEEQVKLWFDERERERERERRRVEREKLERERREREREAARVEMAKLQAIERRVEEKRHAGNDAWRQGNFAEALTSYQAALSVPGAERSKSLYLVHSNMSAVYAAKKEWANSFEHAKKCCTLRTDFSKGYSRMGTALFELGRYEDSIKAFQICLRFEPTNENAQKSLLAVQERVVRQQSVPELANNAEPNVYAGAKRPADAAAHAAKRAAVSSEVDRPAAAVAPGQAAGATAAAASAPPPSASPQTCAQPASQPVATATGGSAPAPVFRSADGALSAEAQAAEAKKKAETAAAAAAAAKRGSVVPPASGTSSGAAGADGAAAPPASSPAVESRVTELQQQGNKAYKAKRFEAAVDDFTKAIALCAAGKVPPQLHSNRSAAFIELGQPTKALEDADACVAIDPRWPKGYSCGAGSARDEGKAATCWARPRQSRHSNSKDMGVFMTRSAFL